MEQLRPNRLKDDATAISGADGGAASPKRTLGGSPVSFLHPERIQPEQPGAIVDIPAKPYSYDSSAKYELSKRVLDFVFGFMGFIISLPIIIIAAICIRLESPGSPFFCQTRLGKDGKPFRIFKLRGMYADARSRFPHLYDYSHNRDLEFHFHYKADPRITRTGRFIRRTSIDELPNFWNVIVGDMSLVGPRPEIPEILDLYGHYRDQYLRVKPGVTCLSKCTGRDALTKRESIEFDLEYVRKRSLKLDLAVLWWTFRGVILRSNVY